MSTAKQRAPEKACFVSGDAEDFLGLDKEERRLVELRVAITRQLPTRRVRQGLTQAQVAKRLKTSQSRVAKIESGAADVSLDLMLRQFFALGGKLSDLPELGEKSRGNSKELAGPNGKPEKHPQRASGGMAVSGKATVKVQRRKAAPKGGSSNASGGGSIG
jgi:transcriptional regulator with XRE-family HTH domain